MKHQTYLIKKLSLIALIVSLLCTASRLTADILKLDVSADTQVARLGDANSNMGGWDGLQVGNTTERLSILRFDTNALSNIDGQTITSVKLVMTSRIFVGGTQYTYASPQNIEIRQLVAENKYWLEGNGVWESGIEGATQNYQVHDTVAWASSSPLTFSAAGNFHSTVGTINIEGMTATQDMPFEFNIDPSLIQGWLLNADLAQSGIALVSTNVTSSQEVMGFYSKEATNPLYRPYLLVEAVPEPETFALISGIAIMGLLILRKRKHS